MGMKKTKKQRKREKEKEKYVVNTAQTKTHIQRGREREPV